MQYIEHILKPILFLSPLPKVQLISAYYVILWFSVLFCICKTINIIAVQVELNITYFI